MVNRLPLPIAYRIALFISDLHYYFSFRDRRAVKNNLRIILGSEENLSVAAKEVFRNFGRYLVEFFRIAQDLNQQYIDRSVKIENLDVLKRVLSEGKGGIMVTAHICNWELGGGILSVLGYPLMAIALPHKEQPVNDLFNSQREVKGITVVPMNVSVRKSIETLKNNKLVALVADRDFTMSGEVMDFLGKKAFMPKGPAVLSYKTGAPIIVSFITRNDDNTFTLSLKNPIYPPKEVRDEIIERDLLVTLIKQYASLIEAKIKQYPTQWLMFREFWVK